MAVTLIRSDQLRTLDSWDDSLTTAQIAAIEGSAVDMYDVWQGVLSQVKQMIYGDNAGNWYDEIDDSGGNLESLYTLRTHTFTDEKLVSLWRQNLQTVAVPASQNWVVLSTANYPPDKNIAIVTTTKGAVSAQLAGAVGSHDLAVITGPSAVAPGNLCAITDPTGQPIETSGGKRIWGLLQVGSLATDGNAFTLTGNDVGQISFVTRKADNTGFDACPVADIESTNIIYAFTNRDVLSDHNQYALRGDIIDADPTVGSVTLDTAYTGGNFITVDDQPVDIRLDDTKIFQVQIGTTGNFLIKATRNDTTGDLLDLSGDTITVTAPSGGTKFAQGIVVDDDDQDLNVGVTAAGVIDSSTIELRSTTGDALINGADDVSFQTVRETSPLPLDDATAGKISTLFGQSFASISAAIKYAGEQGGVDMTLKTFTAGSNYAQGVNIPAAVQDIATYPIDMNTPANTEQFVFLNGRLLFGGNVSVKNDVYVGDTPASGDIKVDFAKGIKTGDVILSIVLAQ